MMIHDIRGNGLTGASAAARAHYETGLTQLNLLAGDPVASSDAAIAESPAFVMAHALKAYLYLLGTEPAGRPAAREAIAVARGQVMTSQEEGHIAAIDYLVDGHWHAASRTLEDIAIAHPHDLLALQVGHQVDYFTGNSRMLRDRIARALPAWSKDIPGYHVMLGMHAFGLEEAGDYASAERNGRAAVAIEPRDSWAQHAVAHVLEMQGRQADGIAWMRADPASWSRDNFFAVHNWWHLALYHLDLGEIDEVLALYDDQIRGTRSQVVLDMIDASAMLWRLNLRGVDVGDRWNELADSWAPMADAGLYAFNDAHAVMAFVGADRPEQIERVFAAQRRAMQGGGDNAMFTRDVGHALTRAIAAYGEGRYGDVVRLIRPVRNIAARFGGSHAQRDVFDLTLIEAAFRGGDADLARALAAERLAVKPSSPLARLFAERARVSQHAA